MLAYRIIVYRNSLWANNMCDVVMAHTRKEILFYGQGYVSVCRLMFCKRFTVKLRAIVLCNNSINCTNWYWYCDRVLLNSINYLLLGQYCYLSLISLLHGCNHDN